MLNSSLSMLILTLHILDANWRFWEELVQKDDAKCSSKDQPCAAI
ncbi:unnamed protein product [Musa acuminata subsp. burmannicoides]